MEIYMKETGSKMKQVDMESMYQVRSDTKATGKMTAKMEMEANSGLMERCTKDLIIKVENMGMENILGLTVQYMKGIG